MRHTAGWFRRNIVRDRSGGNMMRRRFALLLLAAGVALGPPAMAAIYVDESACAGCHEVQHKAWSGSHHQLAMQEAGEQSVLGDFRNTSFTYAGVTSRFFRRDGKFFVSTDGPDGKLADFQVKHAFGIEPRARVPTCRLSTRAALLRW